MKTYHILILNLVIAIQHVATQECGSGLPAAYMCQANTVSGAELVLDVSTAGQTSHSTCDCSLDSEVDGIRLSFDSQPSTTECGNKLDLLFEDSSMQMRCGVPIGEQSTRGSTATITYTRDDNTTNVDSGYCIRFYSEVNNTKLVLNCQAPHTMTSTSTTVTTTQTTNTTVPGGTTIPPTATHVSQQSTNAISSTTITISNTSNTISTSTPAINTSNSSLLNNSTTSSPFPLSTTSTSLPSTSITVPPDKTNNVTNITSSTQNTTTITPVSSTNSSPNTTHASPTSPAVTTNISQFPSTSTENSLNMTTVLPTSNTTNFSTTITSNQTQTPPNTTNNNTNATPLPTTNPSNTTTVNNNTNSVLNTTTIPVTGQNITDANSSTMNISTTTLPTPTNVTTTPMNNTSISNNQTVLTTEMTTINNTNTVNTTTTEMTTVTEATTPDLNTTQPQSNVTNNTTDIVPTSTISTNTTQNVTSDRRSNTTQSPVNGTTESPTNNTTESSVTNTTESPENGTTSLTTITDIPPGNITGNETTVTTPVYTNTTEENNNTTGNVTEGDMTNVTSQVTKKPTTSGFWEPPVMNYDVPEKSTNIVIILVPILVIVLLCFVMAVTYVMCKRSKAAMRRKSLQAELNRKIKKDVETIHGHVKGKPENPLDKFTVSNATNIENGVVAKHNHTAAKYEHVNETIADSHKGEPNNYGHEMGDTSGNNNTLLDNTTKPQTYEPSDRERDLLQSLELSTIVIEHDPNDPNRYFKKNDPGDWYRVIMKGKKPRDPNSTLNDTTKSHRKHTKRKSKDNSHSNTSSSDEARTRKKSKRSRRYTDLGLTDQSVYKKNRKSNSEINRRHSNIDVPKSMTKQNVTQEMSRSMKPTSFPAQEVEHVPVQARVVVSKPTTNVSKPVEIKKTDSNPVVSKEPSVIKSVNNSEITQPTQQNSMFASGKSRNSVFGSNSKLKTDEASKRPDIVPPLDLKQTSDKTKINIDNDIEEFDL